MAAVSERLRQDTAFLHAHGIEVEPKTLARLFRDVVESFPRVLFTEPDGDLTADELDVLRKGGGDVAVHDLGAKDPVAQAAAEFAALVDTSISTAEAARLLGVDPSRIRQRLTEHSLYGLRWGGRWLLPAFQFHEGRLVPGIGEVIPRLAPGLHPVEVYRWLTTPDTDLYAEGPGKDVSPLDWLRLGNPPEPVARIAANLGAEAA